jgi:hypothetical protein
MQRPLTIREIQQKKALKRQAEKDKTRISNNTQFQTVPIQIFGKSSKLATHQITIPIPPKKHVDIPTYRLMDNQIANLRKRGLISVTKIGVNSNVDDYKKFLTKNKKSINSTNKKKTTKKNKSKS